MREREREREKKRGGGSVNKSHSSYHHTPKSFKLWGYLHYTHTHIYICNYYIERERERAVPPHHSYILYHRIVYCHNRVYYHPKNKSGQFSSLKFFYISKQVRRHDALDRKSHIRNILTFLFFNFNTDKRNLNMSTVDLNKYIIKVSFFLISRTIAIDVIDRFYSNYTI